jgi:hypothetical protein
MPNKNEGQAAIAGVNGKMIKGKSLNVNEARPKTRAAVAPPAPRAEAAPVAPAAVAVAGGAPTSSSLRWHRAAAFASARIAAA